MTTTTLDLDPLDASLIGPVFAGEDPAATTEAAAFNLAITHRPAVVVGAACTEDVVTAVRWATQHRLPVAVQATGHGAVAPVDAGMLITTSRMHAVTVDPVARSARVEAGARWRDVIDVAAMHGLAPLCGSSSHVGVVGYTLGGGVGLLARQYGFAADLVTRVKLVTAEGALRVIDAESDPDLFWAIRGGKGNFGVVAEIEFGLVPVTDIYAGSVFFSASSAADVLHAYRSWAPTLPERTTTSIALLRLPPLETLPQELRGRTVVHLRYAHSGPAAEGEEQLAPMLHAGQIVLKFCGDMPFSAMDAIHQDPTDPMPVWERSIQLRELAGETVDALLAAAGPDVETPLFMLEIRQLGGALSRQPAVPNAVAGRIGDYGLIVIGPMALGTDEAVRASGHRVIAAVRPWTTGTVLLNFLGDATSPEQVATAWTPDVHARLLAVKHRVDPDNVFRFGHALV
jgi:FAD/FMN-containing dehydrogenase